jgi:hypothetical protein
MVRAVLWKSCGKGVFMPKQIPDDLISLKEAGALVGRSIDSLRRWRKSKGLVDYRDKNDPSAPSLVSRAAVLAIAEELPDLPPETFAKRKKIEVQTGRIDKLENDFSFRATSSRSSRRKTPPSSAGWKPRPT